MAQSLEGMDEAGKAHEAEVEELQTRVDELVEERKQASEQIDDLESARNKAEEQLVETKEVLDQVQFQADQRIDVALSSVQQRAEECSREVLEELEAFCDVVSRELRRPQGVIAGLHRAFHAEWGEQLDDDGKASLTRIEESGERLNGLMTDLSRISRLTRRDLTWQEVDLGELARKVGGQLEESSENGAVTLNVEDGLRAQGDPELLDDVMGALLRAAWLNTTRRENPTIEVGKQREGGETVFFVRDNGNELDFTTEGSILGMTRGSTSGKKQDFAPLALSKALRIVRRHGGRMWAEPGLEEGGTVYFTLRSKQ